MSSRYQLIGTTQSGTYNVFVGATVYTLDAQTDPFVATLRLAISNSAGTNPTNWIIRVQQGIWTEEWYGTTTGGTAIALVLNDLFFVNAAAITITLENDATADTALTVATSLYGEQDVTSDAVVAIATGVRSNLETELTQIGKIKKETALIPGLP
jgi:hypothetical protein